MLTVTRDGCKLTLSINEKERKMHADIDIHSISSVKITRRKLRSGTHATIIYLQDTNGGSVDISLYSDDDLHITQLKPEVK